MSGGAEGFTEAADAPVSGVLEGRRIWRIPQNASPISRPVRDEAGSCVTEIVSCILRVHVRSVSGMAWMGQSRARTRGRSALQIAAK